MNRRSVTRPRRVGWRWQLGAVPPPAGVPAGMRTAAAAGAPGGGVTRSGRPRIIPGMAACALFSRGRLAWGERASPPGVPEAIVVTDGQQVEILGPPAIAEILRGLPFTPGDPEAVLGELAARFSSYYQAELAEEPGTVAEVVARLRGRYPALPVSSHR
jgi:hypothetical protein